MKNPLSPRLALLLLPFAVALLSAEVKAAVLSQWTFDDDTNNASAEALGVDGGSFTAGTFNTPGATAVARTPDTTVQPVGGSGYVTTFGASHLGTSESGAIAANNVFTFTLSPTTGSQIDFTQLSFYGWANTPFGAGAATPPTYSFFIQSSATAGTLQTFTSDLTLANTVQPGAANQYFLDLSTIAALQDVQQTTTFTIGIYRSASNTGGNMRIDNMELQGTVEAIPEPSAILLTCSGAFLFLRRRVR